MVTAETGSRMQHRLRALRTMQTAQPSPLRTSEPTTVEEFFDLLDAIRDDGHYVPLAMGAHDRWEAATLGFENIGAVDPIEGAQRLQAALDTWYAPKAK